MPAYVPRLLAIKRCWPGPSGWLVDQGAFRVTVAPDDVAYTTSRPDRSTDWPLALVSSTYSSDADAPPVTTSATRSAPETGHVGAASGSATRATAAGRRGAPR